MSQRNIDTVISELGRSIGLAELRLDDRNYCYLSFDSLGVNMELDSDEKEMTFYSALQQVSQAPSVETMTMLLNANFLGQHTGGKTLGYSVDDKIIALSQTFNIERINGTEFETLLSSFVDAAIYWRDVVEKAGNDSAVVSEMEPGFQGIRG